MGRTICFVTSSVILKIQGREEKRVFFHFPQCDLVFQANEVFWKEDATWIWRRRVGKEIWALFPISHLTLRSISGKPFPLSWTLLCRWAPSALPARLLNWKWNLADGSKLVCLLPAEWCSCPGHCLRNHKNPLAGLVRAFVYPHRRQCIQQGGISSSPATQPATDSQLLHLEWPVQFPVAPVAGK